MSQQRKDDFVQKCSHFFDNADQRCNCDGQVTPLELCKELREQGCGKSVEEIAAWFDEIDTDDNGCITKEEFLTALQKVPPGDIDEKRLVAQFHKIDADGSGFITMEELQGACEAAGLSKCEYELPLDTNDDGKVDLQEFLRMFKEQAKC